MDEQAQQYVQQLASVAATQSATAVYQQMQQHSQPTLVWSRIEPEFFTGSPYQNWKEWQTGFDSYTLSQNFNKARKLALFSRYLKGSAQQKSIIMRGVDPPTTWATVTAAMGDAFPTSNILLIWREQLKGMSVPKDVGVRWTCLQPTWDAMQD